MWRARASWLGWLLLLALCTRAAAGRAQSGPVTQRYQIDATLNAAQRTVRGRLTLSFTNTSARALDALTFHLYLNAFRPGSVFMRESAGALRGKPARGEGRIEIQQLSVRGRPHLQAAERELVPGDFTQLRVPLERPIQVGERVEIQLEFESSLPPLFARSGYVRDFFLVAQWFPKLAKLEPNGEFASFPYHGLGEFYSDFADYELTLRAPSSFAIASPGDIVEQRRSSNQRVLRVRASRVHDFAWVASPQLVAQSRSAGNVRVTYWAPAGYEAAIAEHAQVVERGLLHFGALLGAYPYSTLTVVVPPVDADGGAGMEYPGMIVTAGGWSPTPFAPSMSGAATTAHELAHQWFYGVLATNEVRHPVLDEGLAEWATLDLLRVMFGRREPRMLTNAFDRFEALRALSLLWSRSIAPGLSAPEYTANEYGPSVYGRAALALESIRRAYGSAPFSRALSSYAHVNRFAHPTPRELGDAFDAEYGAGFAERVLFPLLLRGADSAVSLRDVSVRREGPAHVVQVRARRTGEVALPTTVCALDDRGRELARAAWPAGVAMLSTTLRTSKEPARVAADCDRALLLDEHVLDQVWVTHTHAPERSLLGKLIIGAQLLLGWLGP